MTESLYWTTVGAGPADLVVCPGILQTTVNWRGLARAHSHLRWILFDARGQGRSPMRTLPYTLDDHVADLLEVVHAAGATRPILLGFSHGGHVALSAAASHPSLFSRLIVVSCTAYPTSHRRLLLQAWRACLNHGGIAGLAWATLPFLVGPKILDRVPADKLVSAMVKRNHARGLGALLDGVTTYPQSWQSICRRIPLPVQIIRGALDPLVDDTDATHFKTWLPDCSCHVLPDCGHTAVLDDSHAFTPFVT